MTPSTTEEQIRELTQQIEQQVPEVRAVTVSEHLSHNEGFRLVKAMSWGTSLLAILVGVLGVMNTMLMTVFERTHEICVLLAVGWTRGRIMRMILYESACLDFLGGARWRGSWRHRRPDAERNAGDSRTPQPDLSIALLGLSVRHRRCSRNRQRPLSCLAKLAAKPEPSFASRMKSNCFAQN